LPFLFCFGALHENLIKIEARSLRNPGREHAMQAILWVKSTALEKVGFRVSFYAL